MFVSIYSPTAGTTSPLIQTESSLAVICSRAQVRTYGRLLHDHVHLQFKTTFLKNDKLIEKMQCKGKLKQEDEKEQFGNPFKLNQILK